MSAPLEISVNDTRGLSAHVFMPGAGGPWVADVEIDESTTFSGRVAVKVGALELSGTVDPDHSGTHLFSSFVRVVGGAGWAQGVAAKHDHNDGGLPLSQLVADLAAEVGEVVVFDAADGDVGNGWTRAAGSASDALRTMIGDTPWYVDAAGVTYVGPRPDAEIAGDYQILEYDPRNRLAILATERADLIAPGVMLRQGLGAALDEPVRVRDVSIVASAGQTRIFAWCGAQAPRQRVVGAFATIVRMGEPRIPYAFHYRYRIVVLQAGRLALQAVRLAPGLPDLLPITAWPGMAGHSATPAVGGEVLVAFVEGDPGQPVVTHFAPKGQPGFKPAVAAVDGDSVLLGAGAARVVREGDSVNVGGGMAVGPIVFVNPVDPTLTRVKA